MAQQQLEQASRQTLNISWSHEPHWNEYCQNKIIPWERGPRPPGPFACLFVRSSSCFTLFLAFHFFPRCTRQILFSHWPPRIHWSLCLLCSGCWLEFVTGKNKPGQSRAKPRPRCWPEKREQNPKNKLLLFTRPTEKQRESSALKSCSY